MARFWSIANRDWECASSSRIGSFAIHRSPSTLVSQNLHRQTMAEELRLLYVAMTRAKEHVILVAHARNPTASIGKPNGQTAPAPSPPMRSSQPSG